MILLKPALNYSQKFDIIKEFFICFLINMTELRLFHSENMVRNTTLIKLSLSVSIHMKVEEKKTVGTLQTDWADIIHIKQKKSFYPFFLVILQDVGVFMLRRW